MATVGSDSGVRPRAASRATSASSYGRIRQPSAVSTRWLMRWSAHADLQAKVPKFEHKLAATREVHDVRKQNDHQDDHDDPDERDHETGDGESADLGHSRER